MPLVRTDVQDDPGAAPAVDRPTAIGIERDDVLVTVSEHGDGDRFARGEEA